MKAGLGDFERANDSKLDTRRERTSVPGECKVKSSSTVRLPSPHSHGHPHNPRDPLSLQIKLIDRET